MRFWDTSAVVPAILDEARTEAAHGLLEEDPEMTVWWATEVECASAIGRQERHGMLDAANAQVALERLDAFGESWNTVDPTDPLRRTARRLVRVHDLRAADAFQLAAALEAADGDPRVLDLVSLDTRLAAAARREGFSVLVPAAPPP